MARVVLITGCTDGGIGHALAKEFASHSCIVYATARRLESMTFQSPSIKTLALDITSEDMVNSVVSTILGEQGRLDILINNAGIIGGGALIDNTMEGVRHNFETNTFAPLRLCKTVIPSMAERKSGLIINIGSIVGEVGTPWNGLYCAAKAALHAMTDILYMECKPLGIKVMLIALGSVRSNIATNEYKRYSQPEGSLYKQYLPNIIERIFISQQNPMSSTEFARRVAVKALSESPPYFSTIGPNTFIVWFRRFLPRWLMLDFIWKRFSWPSS